MLKITFSPKSKTDLKAIGRYTQNHWGHLQRKKYMAKLKAATKVIKTNPGIGIHRDDILPGIRGYHESRHIIFYRRLNDEIEILRILHDSMDHKRHF